MLLASGDALRQEGGIGCAPDSEERRGRGLRWFSFPGVRGARGKGADDAAVVSVAAAFFSAVSCLTKQGLTERRSAVETEEKRAAGEAKTDTRAGWGDCAIEGRGASSIAAEKASGETRAASLGEGLRAGGEGKGEGEANARKDAREDAPARGTRSGLGEGDSAERADFLREEASRAGGEQLGTARDAEREGEKEGQEEEQTTVQVRREADFSSASFPSCKDTVVVDDVVARLHDPAMKTLLDESNALSLRVFEQKCLEVTSKKKWRLRILTEAPSTPARRCLGFIVYRIDLTLQALQVGKIAVLEDCRGRGYGKKLVKGIIQVAKSNRGLTSINLSALKPGEEEIKVSGENGTAPCR
ncbi:putative acetyltransferase domain-containing protein [Neospora caninum Liverpool]|uniref:Acetyltransferase domain-containing protein,putative n=1 Tax=Neospora caninum (strain Liverpool) TaxID=572307 RepID=F0V8F6_NEOCL|nr:putative acetyltransferase domain-containing protein [Neospora caninum Liverpool]CBZ49997.1 putative acetyltransferase domain-containing protein [Neospora caninum Liverpool]CEL64587.1 TPA: acetyltransferase domain-containing protein,putative [Neospora caninum Liverpool]|eukprot:XP_003880032.1 putative acetyltransferase domain-containing protein [Neospora caninum Liverpool]